MTGIVETLPSISRLCFIKIQNTTRSYSYSLLVFLLIFIAALPAMSQVKPTPGTDRLKVSAQKKLLEQKSLVNQQAFRNIGPSIMSGRVVDIDVNPADATEFYVAYATGGLWHTRNNGQSFNPVFDTEAVLFIGDIAVNWSSSKDSSGRIIWIGTGEVNSSRSSYAGIGIFKSTNGGSNWTYLGLPESHHIGKIQLHPTDKNTAWVAVLGHLFSPNKERGVYKTTDGGSTWKQTLFIDNNTGVVDLDINPKNPDILYAAGWYRTRAAWNFEEAGATGGLFKSTDGGNNWRRLTDNGFPTGSGLGRIGIAVAPSDPSIIYAVIDNYNHRPDTAKKKTDSTSYELNQLKNLSIAQFMQLNTSKLDSFIKKNDLPKKFNATQIKQLVQQGTFKPTVLYDYLVGLNTDTTTPVIGCELYRSRDDGKSWKKVNEKPINIYSSYGYYFGKVFVSPSNADRVLLTGLSIELSHDGGRTFKSIDKENVHSDHHVIWINPNREQHIINGNDGGVNITYDDGAHWFLANNPPVAQFYSITVDNAKPYFVYGGLQDNGSWAGPSNHVESVGWMSEGEYDYKRLGGGDGMQVQVDQRDNNTLYSGSQYGAYYRRTRTGSDYRGIYPQHELGESMYRYNWQTPIHLSIHNQDILYYGSNRFHRSLNKGDSMVTLSQDLTAGERKGDVPFGTLTSIHESPLRFGLIYTGSDDGIVQISKDGGLTWNRISNELPQGLYVSRVLASAFKEGRVFVTLNGYRNDHFLPYLFMSEDYGGHWKQLGMDLPFEPVNVVREDPVSDSILYMGTDGGLYVSINTGTNFMAWNTGLPKSVPIHDIAIQKRDNEIVLGTHGRSLYVAKLDSVQALLSNQEYRSKQEQQASRVQQVANGTAENDIFSRDGIEVACPPVKRKKG